MSAPLCLVDWLVGKQPTNGSSCVKGYQGGGVKPHEETHTPKLIEKGLNGINTRILGRNPHLSHATSRITNLNKHSILYNRNSVKWVDRADALFPLILSLVLKLLSTNNGILRKEDTNCARELA